MSQNLQETSFQYIIDRIRKDIKASVLTTLLMNLLKIHKVYKQSQDCAKMLQISSIKKNTEIIAFRASYLTKVLVQTQNYTLSFAADYICKYLRQNLVEKVIKKYMKQWQQNPQELVQVADSVISEKIQIYRKILKTDPTDQMMVKEVVSELYGHHPSKRKLIHKITGIFCRQRISKEMKLNLASTGAQQDHFGGPQIQSKEPIIRQQQQEEEVLYKPISDSNSELLQAMWLTEQQRQRWRNELDFEENYYSF